MSSQSDLAHCPIAHQAVTKMVADFRLDGLSYYNGMWKGACPIHGGDNDSSFRVYEATIEKPGKFYWKCYTRGCEKTFGFGSYGLLNALFQRDGIKGNPAEYLRNIGVELRQEKNNQIDLLLKSILKSMAEPEIQVLCQMDTVRRKLLVPSPYFQTRGFPAELLSEYAIGDCVTPGKPMSDRAVVPVTNDGIECNGAIARSLFKECPLCKSYHKPGPCPMPNERHKFPKWLNMSGLKTNNHLFGIDRASPYILSTRTIVLCEGVGEVLRLNMAGVDTAVSIFGASLHDNQIKLIQRTGAYNVILAFDMDEAGESCYHSSLKKLKYFNCIRLPPELYFESKDIGEVTIPEQLSLIRSFITSYYRNPI